MMCNHKNLSYLGVQRIEEFAVELTLYNCLDCKSTISVESKDKTKYSKNKTIKTKNTHKKPKPKLIKHP